MSYKRAWALVDQLNTLLAEPAVVATTGGARGGGAVLSPAGLALVADYRAMEDAAEAAAAPLLAKLVARTRA